MVDGLKGLGRVTKVEITLNASRGLKTVESPKTLGDYLRNRRLELRLSLPKAARLLGVSRNTLCEWESRDLDILAVHYPKIINFLGRIPPLFTTKTTGQKILTYRLIHGMSQRELALLLEVSQGALSHWQRDIVEPRGDSKKKIEGLLSPMMKMLAGLG